MQIVFLENNVWWQFFIGLSSNTMQSWFLFASRIFCSNYFEGLVHKNCEMLPDLRPWADVKRGTNVQIITLNF